MNFLLILLFTFNIFFVTFLIIKLKETTNLQISLRQTNKLFHKLKTKI